ncbi:MAG: (Fe-S)-binding protein [Thermoplasmata archaeon]
MAEQNGIEALRKDAETCFGTSCNFCEKDCPIYKIKKDKTYTSRGKNRAILGVLEGKVKPSEELLRLFYSCVLCGSCDARCAMENNKRFRRMRAELVKRGLALKEHRELIAALKATGDIYGRKIDLAKRFEDIGKDGVVPLYIGCQYKDQVEDVRAAVKVLNALGIRPRIGDEYCCGFVADALGFESELKEIMTSNAQVVTYKEFITMCPSCTHFFRTAYGLKPRHIVEVVAESLDKLQWRRPRGPRGRKLRVTYHDPCDLGRRLKLFDEPRMILEAMGVELVEMRNNHEFSLCCGSGGGILTTDRPLAREMAKSRMRQAVETGADLLVTCCPTCELALLRGSLAVAREGRRMEVAGLYRFMAEHLREQARPIHDPGREG